MESLILYSVIALVTILLVSLLVYLNDRASKEKSKAKDRLKNLGRTIRLGSEHSYLIVSKLQEIISPSSSEALFVVLRCAEDISPELKNELLSLPNGPRGRSVSILQRLTSKIEKKRDVMRLVDYCLKPSCKAQAELARAALFCIPDAVEQRAVSYIGTRIKFNWETEAKRSAVELLLGPRQDSVSGYRGMGEISARKWSEYFEDIVREYNLEFQELLGHREDSARAALDVLCQQDFPVLPEFVAKLCNSANRDIATPAIFAVLRWLDTDEFVEAVLDLHEQLTETRSRAMLLVAARNRARELGVSTSFEELCARTSGFDLDEATEQLYFGDIDINQLSL